MNRYIRLLIFVMCIIMQSDEKHEYVIPQFMFGWNFETLILLLITRGRIGVLHLPDHTNQTSADLKYFRENNNTNHQQICIARTYYLNRILSLQILTSWKIFHF